MTNTQEVNNEVYIPPGAVRLDNPNYHLQLRLGIQGPAGWGKSYAGMTFRNPIAASFDRGLISHIGRNDIIEIPFYNDKFVNGIEPKISPEYTDLRSGKNYPRPANRKDAFLKWLSTEGKKLKSTQTLVVDGNSGLEAAYHTWYRCNPDVSKAGEENKYSKFTWKINYYDDVFDAIKALECDVVFISHETPDRNDDGSIIGIRPLLSGQYADKLPSHFTDWFRATCVSKPPKDKPEKLVDFTKAFCEGDSKRAQEFLNSTPSNCDCVYLWQTQSTEKFACKTSLVGAPKFVLANASIFKQYKREIK